MIRHSIRNRLILSYIIVGTVLLIVFSSIIMYTTFRNARLESWREVSHLLEQNYQTAEALITDLSTQIIDDAIANPAVIMALHGDNFQSFGMFDIHSELLDIVQANPLIDSIYIYNTFVDTVFSSISAARTPEEFYEPGIRELVDRALSDDVYRIIPRYVTLRNITNVSRNKRWITIVLNQANDASGSAVLINISQSALQNMIYRETPDTPDSFESWIIRTDGVVVSHENNDLFGENVGDLPYVRRIFDSPETTGEFVSTMSSRRIAVGFIKSKTLDSMFMTVVGHADLIREARRSLIWLMVITGIFVVVGGIGALFFTRFIYTPLGGLVRKAESGLAGKAELLGGSEVEIVSSFINFMSLRLSDAQRTINEYIPDKKREALRKVLYGAIPAEASPDYWHDEFDIDLTGPHFVTVIFRFETAFDQHVGFSKYRLAQQHRSETIEYIVTDFSRFYRVEIVDMDPRELVAILNIDAESEPALMARTSALAKDIADWSERTHNEGIWVCLGPLVDTVDEIQSGYSKNVEISRYRMVRPDTTLICADDIANLEDGEYEYPVGIEKKIVKAIRLSDETDLSRHLSDFAMQISTFRFNEIMLSLTQLVLIISRSATESMDASIQERWIRISAEQRQDLARSLDQIIDWIHTVCIEIINQSKRIVNTKHLSLVEQVKTIVNADYGDNALCAASIAESVGLSTNYLRQIFKDATGDSLSEFISSTRFGHAMGMLTDTDLSTRDIAGKCGFYNVDYFYYAFRKKTGKTPGSYRKSGKYVEI